MNRATGINLDPRAKPKDDLREFFYFLMARDAAGR